jgi:hypothetical protein
MHEGQPVRRRGQPATAVPITQGFEVKATEGSLAGQTFTGTFTYESSLLTGNDFEVIDPEGGLTVSFTFAGITYTEMNDIDFPNAPLLFFGNGGVQGLSFTVDGAFLVSGGDFGYFDPVDLQFLANSVRYTGPVSAVAEPGLLAMLGTGLLALGAVGATRGGRAGAALATA